MYRVLSAAPPYAATGVAQSVLPQLRHTYTSLVCLPSGV
jgi:hypothetical protein